MQLCDCGSMLLFCACIPANSVCMLLASVCLYGLFCILCRPIVVHAFMWC